MPRIFILVFAKLPESGKVNTRMVPPLSPEEAAMLHVSSLRAVCELASSFPSCEVILVGTPDNRVDVIASLVASWVTDHWSQGRGDLGQRLSRATDRAFKTGADVVLLLGADSPTLPPRLLAGAIEALETHDAVVGPTDDGGYYVLGMRRFWPALFARIDWGTERVADQTRHRAAAAGIDLEELEAWYDLDRFTDLERACRDLQAPVDNGRTGLGGVKELIEQLLERHGRGRTHPT